MSDAIKTVTTQEQDALITAPLNFTDEEFLELRDAHKRNWAPFLAKMDLLWNPIVPPKTDAQVDVENAKKTVPRPSSKEPRFGADCPACGVNARGHKSHHKVVVLPPHLCKWPKCTEEIDRRRKWCTRHQRLNKSISDTARQKAYIARKAAAQKAQESRQEAPGSIAAVAQVIPVQVHPDVLPSVLEVLA